MSPSQVRLLQQSFALIDPIKMDVGKTFYRKLFEISPQTQLLMKDDLARRWLRLIGTFQQLINNQLRSMLTLPATSTQSNEAVTPEIVELAKSYIEHGFSRDQMGAVKEALLLSLAAHLGERLDANTATAWDQLVGLVLHSMTQIMSDKAVQPALPNEHGRTFNANNDDAMDQLFAQPEPEPATQD
jgi:nitric oxide dioxygenase